MARKQREGERGKGGARLLAQPMPLRTQAWVSPLWTLVPSRSTLLSAASPAGDHTLKTYTFVEDTSYPHLSRQRSLKLF